MPNHLLLAHRHISRSRTDRGWRWLASQRVSIRSRPSLRHFSSAFGFADLVKVHLFGNRLAPREISRRDIHGIGAVGLIESEDSRVRTSFPAKVCRLRRTFSTDHGGRRDEPAGVFGWRYGEAASKNRGKRKRAYADATSIGELHGSAR